LSAAVRLASAFSMYDPKEGAAGPGGEHPPTGPPQRARCLPPQQELQPPPQPVNTIAPIPMTSGREGTLVDMMRRLCRHGSLSHERRELVQYAVCVCVCGIGMDKSHRGCRPQGVGAHRHTDPLPPPPPRGSGREGGAVPGAGGRVLVAVGEPPHREGLLLVAVVQRDGPCNGGGGG